MSSSKPLLLSAESIHKSYDSDYSSASKLTSFFNILLKGSPGKSNRIEVLDDINLKVVPGRSLGLIGQNGAGKSTLLKILTGVLQPTHGKVRLNGSYAALLELAAGFDMDQSGYKNIFLKNALMGIGHQRSKELLDDIIDFADIGDAIHKPMKHYSSGMVVRLGFAIVSRIRPDLLITDEVLAVGDEAFQRKCIKWLDEYLAAGGTLLMVSHSPFQINRLCDECIWLRDGKIHMHGPSANVTKAYCDWVDEQIVRQKPTEQRQVNLGNYRVDSYEIYSAGVPVESDVVADQDLVITMTIKSPDQRKPTACLGILRVDGTPIYGMTSYQYENAGKTSDEGSTWQYQVRFPALALLPGRYKLRLHAMEPEEVNICDTVELNFNVSGSTRELGIVKLPHEWK